MDAWVWIVIGVVVLALIVAAVWVAVAKRRTTSLREQFGPEYDRRVEQVGNFELVANAEN